MKAEIAIRVLEEYMSKADLDRNYDAEVCEAFDEAIDALKMIVEFESE